MRSKLDDGREVAFSRHALERLLEMAMPAPHIYLTLTSPEEVVDAKSYAGAQNFRRGDLTLGVVTEDDGCLVVVTALYSTRTGWERAEREGRLGDGRSYRPDVNLPR